MEACWRSPVRRGWDRHSLDAAAQGSVGITDVAIDAYEYLLLLHAADDEVNFGTDPQRIRAVADRLWAVSPERCEGFTSERCPGPPRQEAVDEKTSGSSGANEAVTR